MSELKNLSREMLYPNPDQPRKIFDPEKLNELAQSIRENGILQALLVQPMDDGRFRIIAGERRWRAAEIAGLDELPCQIIEMDEIRQRTAMLVENLQRADLGPLEEAKGFLELRQQGLSEAEIADKIGKSQPYVNNRIRLLRLPESVQTMVDEGKLSASAARVLLKAEPMPDVVERIAQDVVTQGIPVSRLENSIDYHISDQTCSLDPKDTATWKRPKFDLAGCADCENRSEFGGKPRCTNPKCWKKKQSAVEKAAQKEQTEALKAEVEARGETLVTKRLEPDSYLQFNSYRMNDLVDRKECRTCPNRVLYQVAPYYPMESVCTNVGCAQQKMEAQKAELNALRQERWARIQSQLQQFRDPSNKWLTFVAYVISMPGHFTERGVDAANALGYLEGLTKADLTRFITEVLIGQLDGRNDSFKHYLGIQFPPKAERILKGEATMEDIEEQKTESENNDENADDGGDWTYYPGEDDDEAESNEMAESVEPEFPEPEQDPDTEEIA